MRSVEGLDLTRQQVATTAGNIGYDYLIVALGAELAPEAVPGLKEGAETFYTFEGAARLRDVLARFSGGPRCDCCRRDALQMSGRAA